MFLLPLEREFGWTRSQVASVYSIYLLVNGGTAALVGVVFDRLGPRWVYGAGTALLGTAFALASGIDSLWQFYLCIGVLVGLGVSLNGMVPGSALLARWYRQRLSTAIGVAFSATGIGAMLLVPLAQSLIGDYGWRSAYRFLGVGLISLVPVVLLLPWRRFAAGSADYHREARRKKPGEGWTFRAASRTPVFWGLIRTPEEKRDLAAIAASQAKTVEAMKMLDAQLGRTKYVAGAKFSYGDIPVGIMAYRYWQLVPERPDLANLARWYKELQTRKAFKDHVEAIALT